MRISSLQKYVILISANQCLCLQCVRNDKVS